ncbi:accessory factor UbiK family protein [Aestuariispira ectoiniformans]|uniref:accessory factor UbiK family protein n=1 Tax=Aestuariispira ectoiniformans TaxID=2775080 RepID=UPI00223B3DF9|nr:accessory factor UbiK family protein [Aestuariispira ectoiniformans]
MQTKSRIFDDVARVANGAAGVFSGMRSEIEGLVKDRIERVMMEMDLVPREEFDAVKAMAAKAREENEQLAARIDELEQKLAKPAAKKTRAAKPKPASD